MKNKEKKLEEKIEAQLLAYNLRDLHQFLSCYSSKVQVFRESTLIENRIVNGIKDLEQMYKVVFENSPKLNAKVSSRKIEPPKVTDIEHVSGLRGNNETQSFTVQYILDDNLLIETVVLI